MVVREVTVQNLMVVEIHFKILFSPLGNMRISLYDPDNHEITNELYGKEMANLSEPRLAFLVQFTPYNRQPRPFWQSSLAPF